VLAVTAALSIAAGYVLGPRVMNHQASPAPQPVVIPAPAAVHHQPVIPAPLHRVHPRAHQPVVHRPIAAPRISREEAALRAKLREQDAELAALRRRIAANESAARDAQLRASAAIAAAAHSSALHAARHAAATQTLPAPHPQPQRQRHAAATATSTATRTATSPATTTTTSTSAAAPNEPVDVPAPAPDPGANPRPVNPGGVWSEHPPQGTYGGSHGPYPVGVPIDPCTPVGGRVGIVINTINTILGASRSGGMRLRL
jgi:hypothetical protein